MDQITYFKNFPMNTEINIAGTFIYNGIREFNRLKNFYYENEIFHVLYPISVGIERLQKVLIVLLEDISLDQIEDFEDSLITHSHQSLHERILKRCDLKFNSNQNKFLQVITGFYKTCRYNRFNFNKNYAAERDLLIDFLSTSLKTKIIVDDLFPTNNDDKIKNFFGRVVGSISRNYYQLIYKQASKMNIYTYELRSDSPSGKIFLGEFCRHSLQEQYINEQIALKEFIVFLFNVKERSTFHEFIKEIKPLSIDVALINEYLESILEGNIPQDLIDEVDALYSDEITNVRKRIELMNLIGNSSVIFYDDYYIDH